MIWMRSEGNSACEESPSCQLKKMIVNLLLNLLMKVLNGAKLILDDHGNNLDSFRISLESFMSLENKSFLAGRRPVEA